GQTAVARFGGLRCSGVGRFLFRDAGGRPPASAQERSCNKDPALTRTTQLQRDPSPQPSPRRTERGRAPAGVQGLSRSAEAERRSWSSPSPRWGEGRDGGPFVQGFGKI